MMTSLILWLVNELWFGLTFVAITLLGPFLFDLPAELLPVWYSVLGAMTIAGGAVCLTAIVYAWLDRRSRDPWVPSPSATPGGVNGEAASPRATAASSASSAR